MGMPIAQSKIHPIAPVSFLSIFMIYLRWQMGRAIAMPGKISRFYSAFSGKRGARG
jgi:hypothetical protein